MMTRRQLQFFSGIAGSLCGMTAFGFGCEHMVSWFWAAPALALAITMACFGTERGGMYRRTGRR